MKIGIYSAIDVGDVLNKDIDYIAVDQGVKNLTKYQIHPVYAIGDFDSLDNQQLLNDLDIQILPRIKDVTDTHAAIDYAISKGYDEIDLYGVTGKRLDHFYAVMCLLEKYAHINIIIYDQYNRIRLLTPGEYTVYKTYNYFSFFALDSTYLTIKNAHYNLEHYLLKRDDPLCVSNETDDKATFITSNNVLLIESND